jgi:electron transfer flavoprotein beta subunit
MHARGIVEAYEKEITLLGFEELKDSLDPATIGLKGSPTNVFKSFTKQAKGQGTVHADLSVDEAVKVIIDKMEERHII